MSSASKWPPFSMRIEVASWPVRDIPHMCKGVAPPVEISLIKSGYLSSNVLRVVKSCRAELILV